MEINSIEQREIIPGFKARFVHTERITLAYWEVEPGAELPMHDHPHEQTSQVLEGRFEMTIDGVTQVCEPGQVVIIPSGTPHSGKALTPCKILDVFSPVREDYR